MWSQVHATMRAFVDLCKNIGIKSNLVMPKLGAAQLHYESKLFKFWTNSLKGLIELIS